jgi:ribonuclease P protein component
MSDAPSAKVYVETCRTKGSADIAAEEQHEAHLSAEQTRPQAPPRLPLAHGDHRWPPRYRVASRQGPQAPVGLRLRTPTRTARVVQRLKKRSEFLAARKGRRLNGPLFFIEALERPDDDPARYGLTVTRKVGNAVERNRIRRRLREAIRVHSGADMVPGFDYVIVARRDLLSAPFDRIEAELSARFRKVARGDAGGRSGQRARPPGT